MTPTEHGKMGRVGLGEEQGQAGELLPSVKGKLSPAEIPVARPMPLAMAVFSEEHRRDRQPMGLWENWCCQYSKTGAMGRVCHNINARQRQRTSSISFSSRPA